jgi:hypothetical protein
MRKEEEFESSNRNNERTGCTRGTRLDMGQYGLEEMGTPLTYDKQNALHILRRTRTGKELDCGLQEGQAR